MFQNPRTPNVEFEPITFEISNSRLQIVGKDLNLCLNLVCDPHESCSSQRKILECSFSNCLFPPFILTLSSSQFLNMYLHPPKNKNKMTNFFSKLPRIIHVHSWCLSIAIIFRGWKFQLGLTCKFNTKLPQLNESAFFDHVFLASLLELH